MQLTINDCGLGILNCKNILSNFFFASSQFFSNDNTRQHNVECFFCGKDLVGQVMVDEELELRKIKRHIENYLADEYQKLALNSGNVSSELC